MILVDANLLLCAAIRSFPQHEAARSWLEGALNGDEPVALPWPSLLAFLRISTNARVFRPPLETEAAWRLIEAWLACPTVWTPCPGERHAAILGGLVRETGASGNLVPDAHLAALALENDLVVCSTDRDFARFSGVQWRDPIGS